MTLKKVTAVFFLYWLIGGQWKKLDFGELQNIDVINVIDSFLPSIKLTKLFEMKLIPEVKPENT